MKAIIKISDDVRLLFILLVIALCGVASGACILWADLSGNRWWALGFLVANIPNALILYKNPIR